MANKLIWDKLSRTGGILIFKTPASNSRISFQHMVDLPGHVIRGTNCREVKVLYGGTN